ncbi:hypothetical protein GIB67_042571 [Kingdonia uniflora]|uniref:J domain-containing protein n=1 Tax=Kingdonia uniflora TaxID=39325 RepID=A0A7J7M193_9MAGN|nr:hypothetical protein GIB67_042571 [Kingdonia uniflora]
MARKRSKSKEEEALNLKTLAETKYKQQKLKSALKYAKKACRLAPTLANISAMITTLKILNIASKTTSNSRCHYDILKVEPFSHINSIKNQYKKLALLLHPDKNTCLGSEEAFKLVSEAFGVLSDKIRRKEYDLKLRIEFQSQIETVRVDTFWTACSTCRLFHEFDRRYVGHNLLCPSCDKRFLAFEVPINDVKPLNLMQNEGKPRNPFDYSSDDDFLINYRVKTRKISSLEKIRDDRPLERTKNVNAKRKIAVSESAESGEKLGSGSRSSLRLSLKAQSKKVKDEGDMTLAEMQAEAKRMLLAERANKEKENARNLRNEKEKKARERPVVVALEEELDESNDMEIVEMDDSDFYDFEKDMMEKESTKMGKGRRDSIVKNKKEKEVRAVVASKRSNEDTEIMAVDDSDFYNFDKDRVERSFKIGQVWAVYDDDDGMPRHYGLIDKVSVNPFNVKMSWLNLENNRDQRLISWEKSGFHVSCGRFKVASKISIHSVNVFSHKVECERVAREVYRIYPKKGSIWAIYSKIALDGDKGCLSLREKRRYDIVVFLTSYSEMHGLSMAFLEKVEGFKTIFKRREIGCHAIILIDKDDARLFSHQIPAKKLSGPEVSENLRDCWELDPASVPSELPSISWGN